MAFNIRKPLHILCFILLLFSFYLLFIDPILSFAGVFSFTNFIGITNFVFMGLLITVLFVIIPFLWYYLVDSYSSEKIFESLSLHGKGIDLAFIWGIVAAILMFVITIVFSFILISVVNVDQESLRTVLKTAADLSLISIVIIFVQTIAAEIYFRGFMFEKINSFAGKNIAIVLTAVLYGILHISYGNIYPIILPIFGGLILGYVVAKTKNLYSAMFAQIFFNLIVFITYGVAQTLI
jgi:membrane protease YdiL (CAAX protease family)